MRRTFPLLVLTPAASPHPGLPTPGTTAVSTVSGVTAVPAIAATAAPATGTAAAATIGAAVAAARPEASGRDPRAMGEHRHPGATSERATTDASAGPPILPRAKPLVLPETGRGPSPEQRRRTPTEPPAGRRRPERVTATR
jgi:hypothetical protein